MNTLLYEIRIFEIIFLIIIQIIEAFVNQNCIQDAVFPCSFFEKIPRKKASRKHVSRQDVMLQERINTNFPINHLRCQASLNWCIEWTYMRRNTCALLLNSSLIKQTFNQEVCLRLDLATNAPKGNTLTQGNSYLFAWRIQIWPKFSDSSAGHGRGTSCSTSVSSEF